MGEQDKTQEEHPSAMLETSLGPVGAGLPPIPEPAEWDSAYGIDEAVAIAVTPERALVFWELAGVIEAGIAQDVLFRLIRLRLAGETPQRESSRQIEPIGRHQDPEVEPGGEYLYVIARVVDGEEIPLMVTNPIRMPLRRPPRDIPADLPSSPEVLQKKARDVLDKGKA